MTRAPFATAQRIAFASASTGIDRCGPTTFATSSSAGGASPAMPMPSFVCAAIRPATNVPCPCVSTVAGPADEALGGGDPPLQLGMGAVDARVDHGHANRRERRRLGPASNARFCGGVPLAAAGSGSFGTNACRRLPSTLDVAHARACRAAPPPEAPRRRARGSGARSTIRVAPRLARSRSATVGAIGAGREPDREPRGIGRRRRGEAERDGRDERRSPLALISSLPARR